MKIITLKKKLIAYYFFSCGMAFASDDQLLDRVVAVVNDEVILQSELNVILS